MARWDPPLAQSLAEEMIECGDATEALRILEDTLGEIAGHSGDERFSLLSGTLARSAGVWEDPRDLLALAERAAGARRGSGVPLRRSRGARSSRRPAGRT